ncbi:MAG: DAK2 domain-containing protein [Paenibacillaceae bacterium]|nr:DAK2 domain-containing protein [Paenibacillaceae bacterium]
MVSGAERLKAMAEHVNALNVFPVPDGDTGSNMSMTMSAGVEELLRRQSGHAGKCAEALAKGLLLGARGNSGVILSQLFRGFAKAVAACETIDAAHFAAALQTGVDAAFKAVVKPVEGTILTVARESAKHAVAVARRTDDVAAVMSETLRCGQETLAKTPDMLPVLKQVGVVDAGGQGLICIYEGFMAYLSGEQIVSATVPTPPSVATFVENHDPHRSKSAQSQLSASSIEHGYCTEFIIKLAPAERSARFEEGAFRSTLGRLGDSLLVVADEELVKVHIHAESPGNVMNEAMRYGELTRIKIENMREQHAHIVSDDFAKAGADAAPAVSAASVAGGEAAAEPQLKRYGVVAIAAGEGLSRLFASLGADVVLSGGQTMNPSTEDIVRAVQQVPAQTVFVLPNNGNIVMAARQAEDLVSGRKLVVVPTKTIPQGMSALIAFKEKAEPAVNAERMEKAAAAVQSGQVTTAVRYTEIDGVTIAEGDYLGIHNGRIVVSSAELATTLRELIDSMLQDGGEVVTILTGEDARQEEAAALAAYIAERYPEVETDIQTGEQPVYRFILSAE